MLVKIPLVYTSVALRNWRAFHKLGIAGISAPGSYWTGVRLNWPVDIGGIAACGRPTIRCSLSWCARRWLRAILNAISTAWDARNC